MAEDWTVWTGILRQDAPLFDAFYREQAPRLLAFLRMLVGDRHAAEDLMQDTSIQIWTHPQGYQPERGTLRAYLFGIGRKRAAEWWRRQRPVEPLTEDGAGYADLCDPAAELTVIHALGNLAPEQRNLLWLREVEGQSYAELAAILEIPVGTVRSRLHAAREALRRVCQAGSAMEKI